MPDFLQSIDYSIFYWLNENLINHYRWLDALLKFLAVYLIYALPFAFLIVWFFYKSEKNHKLILTSFLAGVISWQIISRLIGWFYFRARPFSHLAGTRELVFHLPTYSFPSDHAALLAALTTYFYLSGHKKVGHWMLLLTLFIPIARVITGLHWPMDILAGWIVGLLIALIFWWLRKSIDQGIIRPILLVMRKIRLA